MTEIVSIPLIKLILFLAALYAPGNTAEIAIHHPDEVKVYQKDRGIWVSTTNPEDAFSVKVPRLLTPKGFFDLESEMDAAFNHDWSTESILTLSSGIEVLKTKEGLLIYPEGIQGDGEPIKVIYKLVERKPRIPRPRVIAD